MATWDAIIVGAGPAGATAARMLARAGHDVLLLDRARFPRAKACGDCVSAGATPLLKRWGLLDEVLAQRPALLDGWRMSSRTGDAFGAYFHPPDAHGVDAHDREADEHDHDADAHNRDPHDGGQAGALALPRLRLDDVLTRAATASGACLVEDAHVVDLHDHAGRISGVRYRREGCIENAAARLVIGADGLRSIVARRMGATLPPRRPRRVSLSAHVPARALGLAPTGGRRLMGRMHVDDDLCIGLAPVESGADPLVNLTVVALAHRHGRELAADRHAFFARAAARLPDVAASADRLTALLRSTPLLASGPFHQPTRHIVRDGAALVGDAAGYYDPFTGQGIFQALSDGALLAGHAHFALDRGNAIITAAELSGYVRERTRRVRPVRRLQRAIDCFVSRPALFGLAARRLASAPRFADTLAAVTGDLRGTRSLVFATPLMDLLMPTTTGRTPC